MYSRRKCGLCDKARAVILAERERAAFEFHEVLIDGHDDLEREYGLRVPVLEINGVEQFEFQVDSERLTELLRGGGAGREGTVRRREGPAR
jgi:glutaredoxin